MKTMNRSAAAPARGLALLSAASLLLVSVAAPAFAEPLDADEDTEDPIESAELEATLGSEAEGEPVPDDEPAPEGRTQQGREELDEGEPVMLSLEASEQPEDDAHCPGANPNAPAVPDGYVIVTDNDSNDSSLIDGPYLDQDGLDGTHFCVKGGTWASGIMPIGSGTYTTTFSPGASPDPVDISYYMTYLREEQPETVTVTLQKNWTGDDEEFFGHLQDGEFVTEILTVEVNGDEHPESPFALESTGPGVAPFAAFDVGEGDVVEVTDEEVLNLPDADDCAYDPNFPEAITVTEDTTIVVTNDVTCGDDDTVTITLVKEWFDFEGNLVDEPEGIEWGINLYVGTDEEPSASLPGDDNVVTMDLLEDGAPARYGIQEEPAPEGWEAVPCDTVRFGDLTWVNEGTSELLVEGGADSGAFGASESGVHLVCNQEIDDNGPPPSNGPPPEEDDPLSLVLVKAWDVTDEDDLWSLDDATYTLTIGGVAYTAPVEVEEGDELLLGEQDVTVSDGCTFDGSAGTGDYVVDAEDANEDGVITRTITNEVSCEAEVDVLPIVVDEPEPDEEPEPVTEPQPVVEAEPETEVLPTVLERALPRTGADIGVLSLLGVALLLMGGTAVRWTLRRDRP